MTDHFAIAQKLMSEVDDCRDPGLPFIKFKLEKAAVHAQLAQVQAMLCAECPVGAELSNVVDLKPKPRRPRDIQTTGDRL